MAPIPKSDVTQTWRSSSPSGVFADLYRIEWGRIVAILIRLVGDFDLAEEAEQEAFAAALSQWQTRGIPDLPRAFLVPTTTMAQ